MKYGITLLFVLPVFIFKVWAVSDWDILNQVNEINSSINKNQEKINKVETKIIKTNSDILRVQGEINIARAKIPSMQAQMEMHKKNQKIFKAQLEKLEVEKSTINQEIDKIVASSNKQKQEIEVRKVELSSLKDFTTIIQSAYDLLVQIDQRQLEIMNKAKELLTDHIDWLEVLKAEVSQNPPDFPEVVDKSSYNQELEKILAFENKKIDTLMAGEDEFEEVIAQQITNIFEIQAKIRSWSKDKGLITFLNKAETKHDFINNLKQMDITLLSYYKSLNRIKSLVFSFQTKRKLLKSALPVIWNRILEGRLHIGGGERAAKTVNEGHKALSSNIVFVKIKSILNKRIDHFKKILHKYALPRLARKEAITNLEYVHELEKRVPDWPIHQLYLDEISYLLHDYKINFQTRLKSAIWAVEHEEQYLDDLKNEISAILKKKKLTPECQLSAEEILKFNLNSIELEEKVLTFRTRCK